MFSLQCNAFTDKQKETKSTCKEGENKCDFNDIYSTRCFTSDQDRIFKEPDVPLIQTK